VSGLNDEMKLDSELLSLHETLGELIDMGLVKATFYPEEEGIGPSTRYSLTAEAPAIVEDYSGAEIHA
jgi:DNA-binding HxlR family transcriptional regulator